MRARLLFLVVLALLLSVVAPGPARTAAAADAVTISPDTLPDVTYGTYPNQMLTATGDPALPGLQWRVKEGSLPPGMTLQNYPDMQAKFAGAPSAAGTFTFTVEAYDYDSGIIRSLGTKPYTWTILKATPLVRIHSVLQDPWAPSTHYISIYVDHSTNPYWTPVPVGPVTVFLGDGPSASPLAGCIGIGPILSAGFYQCATSDLANLGPGSYTLRADFTPDSNNALNYISASGTAPFTVLPRVEGVVFNDLDRDGDHDAGEQLAGGTVDLDLECNGSYETHSYIYGSEFSIPVAPGSYCLNVTTYGNWRPSPTTALPIWFEITATANQYFEIGIYETVITFSPGVLPDATIGEPYSQTMNISGGKAPYTVSYLDYSLPDGMTFDPSTLTLSGTPTAVTPYLYLYLSLGVEDADGMTGSWSSQFHVNAIGTFTLTSSPNPSGLGQEVTFTFNGFGDVVISDPEYGDFPIPPYGTVAFYDGDALIAGCEAVLLNYDWEDGWTDKPALCLTSALSEGSHQIRADFTSYNSSYNSSPYHDASRTLTQVVGTAANTAPTANPGGPYLGAVNTAIAFDGSSSSDPEGDPLTYSWTFGDTAKGTGPTPTHGYAAAGVYTACLTVSDGEFDSAPNCTLAVVYDPSAGFVSGGGWITSPAYSEYQYMDVGGKATFGFVSKYQKGANVPTGETAFVFKAGNMDFYSNTYDWLVVAGAKAQFKGTGTINGAGEYGFMLTASDGQYNKGTGTDKLRIKIWNKATNLVVYDNQVGASDADAPATDVEGGNIVVHAK